MGKYFGTDGFRGEANVVLTVEHAFKVGRYLGWYYGQEHKAKIVIGKDTSIISRRIGIAKGRNLYDDRYDFDEMNPEIAKLFGGME